MKWLKQAWSSLTGLDYFVAFIQFFYLYQLFVTDDVGGFSFAKSELFLVVFSLISAVLFFKLIYIGFSHRRRLQLIGSIVALIIYDLLAAYHFGAQELLEWSFVADNINIAFTAESLDVMASSLDPGALQYLPLFLIIFWLIERKRSKKKVQVKYSTRAKYWIVGLYMGAILMPGGSYDPIINFIRSAYYHYTSPVSIQIDIPEGQYPFLYSKGLTTDKFAAASSTKPNIILIVIESLNESALHKTNDAGVHYLPYLRELRNNSVYVDPFYANSVQTAKGHFATFFSVIPSLTGKVFSRYKDIRLNSIATTLAETGYKTVYFGAHKSKNFDNNHDFLTTHGFQQFETVRPYLTEDDLTNRLRWGVEDSVFFTRFFDWFDTQPQDPGHPYFIALTTIANHFPFNAVPENRRALYKDPNHLKEHYANSVHLVDKGIKTFFEQLKTRGTPSNTIVIITGDHSFPMGEHGNYHLEAGYHEESFRIPFYLIWDGVLKPQTIKRAHSQMDIAPTILDLINYDPPQHNIQGESIFKPTKQKPIYCIQPYGKHLIILDHPQKYRLNTKIQKQTLYNLDQDPMETQNRFHTLTPTQKAYYTDHLTHIYRNQAALVQNQFWPKSSKNNQ